MSSAHAPIDHDAPPACRPLRADAARNRARVIAAAGAEFAERGPEAQMEDVARRAGVGVGTVYRHFETKDALIDALLDARFRQLRNAVAAVCAQEDPWAGILAALTVTAETASEDRCFSSMFRERKRAFVDTAPVMAELGRLWGGLFARAQAVGAMRDDVGVEDLPMLMSGLASAVDMARTPADWRRYLVVLADGLRPPRESHPGLEDSAA
jgi:AcrR family transcriptional regulator